MTTLTPTRLAAMPRVNLLPPEIAAAARLKRTKALLGFVMLAAMAAVVLVYLFVSSQVGGAEEELATAQAQGAALQSQVNEYAEVPEVLAAVDAAQANLTTAMTPEIRWSFYLNDLSLSIPKTTRLASMTAVNTAAAAQLDPAAAELNATVTPLGTPSMGTVTFTGSATDFDAVASWLQTLARQEGYTEPTVTSVQKSDAEDTVGEFYEVETSTALTQEAASNRYLQIATGE
jgi:Tfp pilus assembly protein PilN